MSRVLIGRLIVRCYPTEIRQDRGDEFVGTLLDVGDASPWEFASHAASMARAGLVARAKAELARPVWQLASGALAWAAVLMAVTQLLEGLGTAAFWGGPIFSMGNDPQTVIDMYAIPLMIMGLITAGRTRAVGVLGLVRLVMRLHQSPLIALVDFMIWYPVQILGFGLLAVRPRIVRPAGRYLWTVPAAWYAFYWLTLLGQHSGVGHMTPVIASAILLPLAPSLALGLGIDWLLQGFAELSYAGGYYTGLTAEFLACLPVVLILTAVYRRRARLT